MSELSKDTFCLSTSNVIRINSNANLNDYTTPGNYACVSNGDAKTITNMPSDSSVANSAFRLTVINSISGDYTTQILLSYISNVIGIRSYNKLQTYWSSWKII